MLSRVLPFLRLPAPISAFERAYLTRMNRLGLLFFALHVPAFALLALFNDTNPLLALALTSGVLVGPLLAHFALSNPRTVSLVHGFTAMLMGGLLVHFGQGPVQIEMHFYFFALIAMLAVFANPLVIVTAAVTVALHHLALWAWLPESVFNYGAPLWVVLVHAAFVVLESVAACFIARSFFDNVIGLEKIVQARTAALDARNRDMRLVLDNVQQGFLTLDRAMRIANERSRVVETWLGAVPSSETTFATYLAAVAPRTGASFALAFEEVLADVLPLELTLAQLPQRFELDRRSFRLEYQPIMIEERLEQLLVVITDVTAEVERQRLELEQRDVLQIVGRIGSDKASVLEFFQESTEQVARIAKQQPSDSSTQRRLIHTLKGNCMLFGVQTIAELCEYYEARIDEEGTLPNERERADLAARWSKLCESLDQLLGERKSAGIELDDQEYEAILSAVLHQEDRQAIAERIRNWRLEPTLRRLVRIGEQARAIAQRTGKGAITVDIVDEQLRLDGKKFAPFWSAFVHVVRNAVDHGIESEAERAALGKGRGTLRLATREQGGELVIELSDDGRGVDWRRVADKARERGLPHRTRQDLVEALFAEGLSTLEQATSYSGRGVGMAAVREACQALDGLVEVDDAPQGGTTVRFRFPRVASPAQLKASA